MNPKLVEVNMVYFHSPFDNRVPSIERRKRCGHFFTAFPKQARLRTTFLCHCAAALLINQPESFVMLKLKTLKTPNLNRVYKLIVMNRARDVVLPP